MVVLLALLFVTGCGLESARDTPGVTRADSAGIEIVRNAAGDLRRGELEGSAVQVIGAEEPGPQLFGRVSGARLHGNGSIWVTESQLQELRVFDSVSGAHLFTVGGVGDGPGEFRRLRLLGFDGQGVAYVYDDRLRRLSRFSAEGEFLGIEQLPSSLGAAPRPQHVTTTGQLVGQIPQGLAEAPSGTRVVRDTVRMWFMPLDGGEPTLLSASPGALWYIADGTQLVVPHTGQLPPPYDGGVLHGFHQDRVYRADPSGGAAFSVFGPDGLERTVEVDREREQITNFDPAEFLDHMRRIRWPESRVESYERHLSDMPIPEELGMWTRMAVTDSGGVWLLRRPDIEADVMTAEVPQVWDVFDPNGELVGVVQLPGSFSLMQVSGETLVVIVRDEVGRSSVALHSFRWVDSPQPGTQTGEN